MSQWKKILKTNFRDAKKLLDFIELKDAGFILRQPKFPINLPLRLAKKIKKNSPQDPILQQFLPQLTEEVFTTGFVAEPLQESTSKKTAKLLHKYAGRALLLVSSACAMHCRFCFRQNFPYEKKDHDFATEMNYLRQDKTIREVILSGGDPLSMDPKRLKYLMELIGAIPHIKKLRFHSRFPIGIPERIDRELLDLFQSHPQQIIFALHINHPVEWGADLAKRIKMLQQLGIPILAQTVLLRGVNDDEKTLYELFSLLTDCGALPYYLHFLDPVAGSQGFATTKKRGIALLQQLRKKLPGYAIPRFVQEECNKPHKTLLY